MADFPHADNLAMLHLRPPSLPCRGVGRRAQDRGLLSNNSDIVPETDVFLNQSAPSFHRLATPTNALADTLKALR
jgi:hypothetical protein